MFEVHKNISGRRFVYVWEVTATFRNRVLAYEECERLRTEGFWAIVKDTDEGMGYARKLHNDARACEKRYEKDMQDWQKEGWGSAEVHSASMEVVFEAFTEYQSEKIYW